jgi:hypothetical protein
MKKLKALFVLIGFVIASSANAQKPAVVVSDKAGWHKIGEVTASFKAEKDELVVMGADKFKAIKLFVKDAPMNISDLEIYYEDGSKETVALTNEFKAGGESRVIDIKAAVSIKKVIFSYKSIANSKDEKATVELYGMK